MAFGFPKDRGRCRLPNGTGCGANLARGFDAGADAGEEWVLGRREGFHLLHINHLSLIRLMGMPGHAIQAYRFSGATLGPAIRLFSVSGEG